MDNKSLTVLLIVIFAGIFMVVYGAFSYDQPLIDGTLQVSERR